MARQLAIVFAAIMALWTVCVAILTRNWTIAAWDLGIALAAALVPALLDTGRTVLGRNALVTLLNGTLLLFAGLFGEKTGTHYCFLPATALPFALFPTRRRLSLAYGTLLPLALFAALVASRFGLFGRYEEVPELSWVYWLTISCAFGISFATMFLFARSNEQSELRLKASEERYSRIVESAQEGIWAFDDKWRTTYANPEMASMLGYSPAELAGREVFDFIDERLRPEAMRFFERRRAGSTERQDLRFRRKDGVELHALLSIGFAERGGAGPASAVALVLNVTELRLKERLIEKQRMQMLASAKLSALGEMASGIAHEINNPLTALNFRIAMMRNLVKAEPFDREKAMDYCDRMERIVHRAAQIIQGLRTFSRDEEGAPCRRASVRQLIDDTIAFCGERFASHGIELSVEYGEPGLELECRPVQISQVLLNLLNNAHDAVESQEARKVSLAVANLGGVVEISVSDNGPGIPAQVGDKVLEPFFTTKEVGKGTGLGLSVSRGIVESHNGSLAYESEPGRTRFYVRLPKEA